MILVDKKLKKSFHKWRLFLVLGAKVRIKKGDFSSSLLILAVIANDRETISTLHPTSWKKY
jgi:hypothetical protein